MTGPCNRGATTFRPRASLMGHSTCHCGQCRKHARHVRPSAGGPKSALRITGAPRWVACRAGAPSRVSPNLGIFSVRQPPAEDRVSLALGAFDTPTGPAVQKHILTADKGDYHDIDGAPPQPAQS